MIFIEKAKIHSSDFKFAVWKLKSGKKIIDI